MLNPAQGHQFRNPELGLLSSCNGMAVVSSHVPFRRNPSASWAMASSALGSACDSRRERFLVMSALALPRLGTLLKHRWGNNDWITRSANSYALMLVALILEGPVVDAFEKCKDSLGVRSNGCGLVTTNTSYAGKPIQVVGTPLNQNSIRKKPDPPARRYVFRAYLGLWDARCTA